MLIRNDKGREGSIKALAESTLALKQFRKKLKTEGKPRKETKALMEPLMSFHEDIQADIDTYDRWKSGDLSDFEAADLDQIGTFLIAARIAQGISQRQLAEMLKVNESTVSRDERNEYHGITIVRAVKILKVLGVSIVIDVWPREILPPPHPDAVP